jgi:serine/threonine protein kinase
MEKLSTPDVNVEQGSLRLPAGTILQSRYRLVRELGSGGMGAVFEAIDLRLDATVALKETFSTDARLRRQFEQEARLLAQLHHPCLPRVSDYFCEAGRAFLVMQFISGPDLAQILSQQPKPFPRNQVIAWADQLLDALIYLHELDRQIIHRDIKPHNLKVSADGRIALLDFGLAKTHAADHSTTNSSHSIFGYTRRYSPPEQIRDLGTTPQSDIYALGATLYHLLTGVKPPDSLERASAIANSEPDPLRRVDELNPAIELEISAILNKAMALNPKDRFRCASEFREVLKLVGRLDLDPRDSAGGLTKAQTSSASVRKPFTTLDPFDSYSILKPDENVFKTPRPARAPGLFAAAAAIILVVIVVAYPGQIMDTATGILETDHATSSRSLTGAASLRPKTDSIAEKAPTNKTVGANPEREMREAPRREETQKRRGSHPAAARPRRVKPPRFSIEP